MGRPQSPCGTESAYKRHVSSGETACEPCRRANAEAGRLRRAKKAAKDRGEPTPAHEVPTMQDVEVALADGDAEDLALIRGKLRDALEVVDAEKVAPIARAFLEVIMRTRPAQSEQPKATEAVVDEFERARQARAARTAGA